MRECAPQRVEVQASAAAVPNDLYDVEREAGIAVREPTAQKIRGYEQARASPQRVSEMRQCRKECVECVLRHADKRVTMRCASRKIARVLYALCSSRESADAMSRVRRCLRAQEVSVSAHDASGAIVAQCGEISPCAKKTRHAHYVQSAYAYALARDVCACCESVAI